MSTFVKRIGLSLAAAATVAAAVPAAHAAPAAAGAASSSKAAPLGTSPEGNVRVTRRVEQVQTRAGTITKEIYTIRSGTGTTLRARLYEDRYVNFPSYCGYECSSRIDYYGSGDCSSSTLDADYSRSAMPTGWNDRVSAVKDYAYCDVHLYRDNGFLGGGTGYVNYGSSGKDVPYWSWDNEASSFRVS